MSLPTPSTCTAYSALTKIYSRLYNFAHLSAMASWDSSVNMPSKGAEARGNALAEVSMLMHSLKTDQKVKTLLDQAAQEDLSPEEKANLHEIKVDWTFANGLPEDLVERKALLGNKCEHDWRTQRADNDWQGFLQNFKPVVEVTIEEAKLLQTQLNTATPYDALLMKYEPGQSSQVIRQLFSDLRPHLTKLIEEVRAKQEKEEVIVPKGPFSVEKQRALGLEVMGLLGFDFEAGRLDVSKHPFCGGVSEDVRITTRYREDDFIPALMGVIHETGHARYEQNLPTAWRGQPAGLARSMGMHESQSLFFEMQIARSKEFISLLQPLIVKHFGEDPAFTVDNLCRLITRVKPSFIRVDADELTYPLHVILRFEIEEALINGHMIVEDLPKVWEEKMRTYLGVDTHENYRDGCMQDIHWTDGSFGYFPTYTLGAMYAAQWKANLAKVVPDYKEQITQGNLQQVFAWLRENIWSKGSLYPTDEIVRKATGESLNPAHYLSHLHQRYVENA
eukprot:gene6778-7488_t